MNSGARSATMKILACLISFLQYKSSRLGTLGCTAIHVHAKMVAIQLQIMESEDRAPLTLASKETQLSGFDELLPVVFESVLANFVKVTVNISRI
jgi:hypothetical protein